MAYQLFYGNPYSPAVAGGVMEGAKEETEFARGVQRAKLRAMNRQISLSEARFQFDRSQAEIVNERTQAKLEADLNHRAEKKLLDRRRARRQKEQWEADYELRQQQEERRQEQEDRLQEQMEWTQEQAEEQAEAERKAAKAEAKQAQKEQAWDRDKQQSKTMINSLNAGATPVPEDYQPKPNEYVYKDPVTGKHFVAPRENAQGAPKLTSYAKGRLSDINGNLDRILSQRDTIKPALQGIRVNLEQVRKELADMQGTDREGSMIWNRYKGQHDALQQTMGQYMTKLADLAQEEEQNKAERMALREKINPTDPAGQKIDRTYRLSEEYQAGGGAVTPWELVLEVQNRAREKNTPLTIADVLKQLQDDGLLVPLQPQQ